MHQCADTVCTCVSCFVCRSNSGFIQCDDITTVSYCCTMLLAPLLLPALSFAAAGVLHFELLKVVIMGLMMVLDSCKKVNCGVCDVIIAQFFNTRTYSSSGCAAEDYELWLAALYPSGHDSATVNPPPLLSNHGNIAVVLRKQGLTLTAVAVVLLRVTAWPLATGIVSPSPSFAFSCQCIQFVNGTC